MFPLGEIVTESLDDEQLDETTPTNNVKFPGTKNQQAMNMDILVIRKYRIRMNMVLRIYCSLFHPPPPLPTPMTMASCIYLWFLYSTKPKPIYLYYFIVKKIMLYTFIIIV